MFDPANAEHRARLRKAAEDAKIGNPGTWTFSASNSAEVNPSTVEAVDENGYMSGEVAALWPDEGDPKKPCSAGIYIAEAQPDTILAILDWIERWERAT